MPNASAQTSLASAIGNATGQNQIDPYSQQLLDIAINHGGALAQTAAEISHPNGSFMSLAYEKLGAAFHGVMNTLSIPEDAITTLLSQGTGNQKTWEQVRKEHLTPADILLGNGTLPSDPLLTKLGVGSARFITNVLLDPLTYVTFGEGTGIKSIFGLSKISRIPVKESTALSLGFSKSSLFGGAKGLETVKHLALSPEGLAVEQEITTAIEKQIGKDTLESFGYIPGKGFTGSGTGVSTLSIEMPGKEAFYQADNIRGRISYSIKQLEGADLATFDNFLKAKGTPKFGAEYDAIYSLRNAVKENGLLGKSITEMTPAEQDTWRALSQQAVKDGMDKQAERLVKHTISARRADIEEQAKEAMSKMIENNVKAGGVITDKLGNPLIDQFGNKMVRDLAQAFLDKGGVKVFGQALVSGAKIRSAINLIRPATDNVAARFGSNFVKVLVEVDSIRNIMMSSFSPKWNAEGRIPDSAIQMMAKFKNKANSQASAVVDAMSKLWDRLGITREDDKALSWMIAADMPPTSGIDGRYETIYNLLHSPNGQQTALDIVAGKHGDDIANIYKAAMAVKNLNKRNLLSMHEAGLAVFPNKNYISNMLNEERTATRTFRKLKSSKAVNAEKADYVKYVSMNDQGVKETSYGVGNTVVKPDGTKIELSRYSKVEERNRIQDYLKTEVLRSNAMTDALRADVDTLFEKINQKMVDEVMGKVKPILTDTTKDKANYKALEQVFTEAIPQVDRTRILKQYVSDNYINGQKIKDTASGLHPADIQNLIQDLKTGNAELDTIAQSVVDKLSAYVVPVKQGVSKVSGEASTAYDKALAQLKKDIQEMAIGGKKAYLENALKSKPITAMEERIAGQLPRKAGRQSFNTQTMSDVLSGLSEQWYKDPGGISRIMEQILGKEFQIRQQIEDIADVKTALKMELNDPGLKRVGKDWFYKDSEGKIYERLRASAAAINQTFFNGDQMFTESALKQSMSEALNVIRYTNSKYLLDDMAKKFGIVGSEAPSNFVNVGIKALSEQQGGVGEFLMQTGVKGFASAKGQELKYHPAIASALYDLMKTMEKDPASHLIAQAYDGVTNFWKASVTSIFPAFHGRNAISNVFQNMMNIGYEAINPVNHILSAKMMRYNYQIEELATKMAEKSDPETFRQFMDVMDKVVLTDKRGHKWTVGELNLVLRDNVIAFNPTILGNMDTQRSSKEMLTKLQDHTFPSTNKYLMPVQKVTRSAASKIGVEKLTPFAIGRWGGNIVETQSRLVNFMANLRETGDVEHSAQMVRQFLFDYQNLTPFERNFMRRVIPFYTYTRKNMELMAGTMLNKPGRIDMFRNMIQTVGDVYGSDQLSDEERSLLPNWMQDGLSIVAERKGSKVKLITSLGTPFEQPFQAITNLYGSMNPLIKLPVEQATGYSFFYGKPLSQVTDATAYASPLVPQAWRDLIGFTTFSYTDKQGQSHTRNVALNHRWMNFFQNMPLTPRLLSTLKTWDTDPPTTPDAVAQQLFGVSASQVDLQNESAQRQKEMRTQLEDILQKAGVGYKFERFQVNKPKF